mgnify:CR=1 FL=1
MLNHSTAIEHKIFTPVFYEISDLNLTLLPTEVQQHISLATGVTRISQADTVTKQDGTTSTFWQLYDAASLFASDYFESTEVAENFLAGCLL